jgi:hypothetical protein
MRTCEMEETLASLHRIIEILCCNIPSDQDRWSRGLRRRCTAAWFLGSRVRFVLRAWMFVYVVLSCIGRDLCDGLITRPEEPYRVSNCV